MKFLWKNIGTRVWIIVTSVVLVLFITITIVVTQVGLISSTFDILFGSKRAIISESSKIYETEYQNKQEVLNAANELNVKIALEGSVLLKNENNALPLSNSNKITVLGKNSTNLVLGGSGSGGMVSSDSKTIYDSLRNAGFTVNPVAENFYKDNSLSGSGRGKNPSIGTYDLTGLAIGETPITKYNSEIRNSYQEYNDAAIVVISRIGGEGFDLPRTMRTKYGSNEKISGARSVDDHYLQLDENETLLLKEANDNFEKVIVIINASQTMELDFLNNTSHYAYQPNIKGAIWIGSPGATGIMALGKLLNGTATPSGRTVDTYAKDFKKDPTWFNFGDNREQNGNRYLLDGKQQNAYFVNYEESIYVGYRYYETRGFTQGNQWYKDNVVYPFGYGLSYTNFDWEVVQTSHNDNTIINEDDIISIKVKVTNNGNYDGKDVVQLYLTSPYTEGGIEKSHVELVDFAKTGVLAKNGGTEIVELKVSVNDMKSYDWNDANNNGHKGYEIEAGNYELKISENAHVIKETFTYEISNDILLTKDEVTGNDVLNRFDDVSEHLLTKKGYLSRKDFAATMPTNDLDKQATNELINALKYDNNDSGKPWESDKFPTQSEKELSSSKAAIKLFDMIGLEYDDELWDELLNQLTYEQMANLIGYGAFQTADIGTIDKPKTTDSDGPAGFTNFMAVAGSAPIYNTAQYVSQAVIGSTWSEELAFLMGEMIGNEGLIGNERGDGLPYSGWYAPGVNIHRSQFGGRNFEYFSEDPYLSGLIAVNVIKGAKTKGVYTYLKHFAVNDQETHRDFNGLIVWLDEQAMREIYLKPFEMAVKQGETTAMMSSFNRIGTEWAGGNYRLLTEILREEWGFKGMIITDYGVMPYLNIEQMLRAGGDLYLSQGLKVPNTSNITETQATNLRRATKNILFTVANSNAMNNHITGYKLPVWQVLLITLDVLVVIGLGTWGFFAIKKAKTPRNKE